MKTTHTSIFLFTVLISYAVLDTGQDWGGDFAAFIMQAQSIVNGGVEEFISYNTFTISESSYPIGPHVYPWGTPLFLAPIIYIYGFNLFALKLIGVICFGCFLVCLFELFFRYLSKMETIFIIFLFGFNINLLSTINEIGSDIPFLFFSTLSILLIDRFIISSPRASCSEGMLIGTAIFVSYFIRTNGLLLLVTLLICQGYKHLYEGNRKAINLSKLSFVSVIPYITFIVLFSFFALIFPKQGGSHLEHLKEVTFQTLLSNTYYYLKLTRYFFLGVPFHKIIYSITIPVVIIGTLLNFRKNYLFIVYSVLTLLLYIVWPHRQGLRFIFPILPFYIFFLFKGMWAVVESRQHFFKPGHIFSFWFVIAIFFLVNSFGYAKNNLMNNREVSGPFDLTSQKMFDFIERNTENNSVIIFFKPRVMSMITNRNSIMINTCKDLYKGDYYVFHKEKGNYDQVRLEDIEECNLKLELEPEFDNVKLTVYKIHDKLPSRVRFTYNPPLR